MLPVVGRRGQALDIDGDVVHLQTGEAEGDAGGEVARVLDPHRVAVVGEQARAQVEPRLRAAGDEELRGIHREAAYAAGKYADGAAMLEKLIMDDNYEEFLTLPAYRAIA